MNTAEPIHPGEHLREIIEELGISQYRLAKAIGGPPIQRTPIRRRARNCAANLV